MKKMHFVFTLIVGLAATSFFFGCSNDSGDNLDLTPPSPPSSPSASKSLPQIADINPTEGPAGTVVKATISNFNTTSDEIFFHETKLSLRNAPSNQYEFTVPTIPAGSYKVFVKRGAEKSNESSFTVTEATTPPPAEGPPAVEATASTPPTITVSRCTTAICKRALKIDWSFTNVEKAYILVPLNYDYNERLLNNPFNYMNLIWDSGQWWNDQKFLGSQADTLDRLLEDPLAELASLPAALQNEIESATHAAPFNYCVLDHLSAKFQSAARDKISCSSSPTAYPNSINYMAIFFPIRSGSRLIQGTWVLGVDYVQVPLQMYYKNFAERTVRKMSINQPPLR